MNKSIKIILSIVGVLVAIILLDTLQARIFKTSPFISWQEKLEDNDSWVDKGLLMDTYYCTKESDIVTVSWHFKTSKYTCPIDNVKELIEPVDISMITMTIKEGTLTNSGATIIITDTSGKDNTYGEYYRIDKKVDDKWQELDVIVEGNYGFNLIGYQVGEDNTLELTHNWEWLYGKLEAGVYRLVKEVNNKYFSVSFTISNLEDNNEDTKEPDKQPYSDNNTSAPEENGVSIPDNKDTSTTSNNENNESTEKLVIKTIIDKTDPKASCAQAIDVFYEDANYKYYYTCIKSQNIIVKYTNGTEETIKVALKNNHIKISDLDKYNIYYLKEAKQTSIR